MNSRSHYNSVAPCISETQPGPDTDSTWASLGSSATASRVRVLLARLLPERLSRLHSRACSRNSSGNGSGRRWGIIAIALSGFCFGFLGIFGKIAYASGLTIGEALTWRFCAAAIFMALGLGFFSPRRLKISLKQLIICAALGMLGYAVFASFYFKAIQGTSVALASLLLYTYPVLVALGSRFAFGEQLSVLQVIALPLAAGGLALLLAQNTTLSVALNYSAIGFGLASAICYSIYIMASSRLQKTIDPLTSGLFVMVFAALGLFIIHRPDLSLVMSYSAQSWFAIIGLALVCTVVPLVLFLAGLQRLNNTEASLLSTIEPLTAALAGLLILGEPLGKLELLGGSLILAALIATAQGQAKES